MRISISLLFIFLNVAVFGQSRPTGDWIDFGNDHIKKWLQIAPAKLGPNSLPVPLMDYAQLDSVSNIETGVHAHFMEGDQAINSYLSFYWAVVPKRVVVQVRGFPTETFQTDNSVRDERQIYYDDTGWITQGGDLWLSFFIQLVKEHKKWPDIVISYSNKTTTGGATQGRYTDAPADNYYIAFGKSYFQKESFIDKIRIGIMLGFYVWQTNKVELAQDEGPLYELGIDLNHKNLSWRNEIAGYNGYAAYRYMGIRGSNDPLIYRTNFTLSGKRADWKWEYQTGFHDYYYQTFRFSALYKFSFGKRRKG